MGFKTMKMGWDKCSSPPRGPFYPYTMFQNPISWPSHKNAENHNNSKSTCHTKFSHSALQLAYRLTYMCRCATLCEHFFPVQIDVFSVFCQKEIRKQPKFHILLILTGKNASKLLEWHIFRVQGMPNPMLQVSRLCNKWFLKITISGKISHFVDFDWEKCIKIVWVAHI